MRDIKSLMQDLEEIKNRRIDIDYGTYLIESIANHAFSLGFEQNTPQLDEIYANNRFRQDFTWLMMDWLRQGELFLHLINDEEEDLRIARVDTSKVHTVETQGSGRITFLRIQYQQEDDLWFRRDYTPDEILHYIPKGNDNDEGWIVSEVIPNPLEDVPFAYFKWENEERGKPITEPVANVIKRIDEVLADIRYWNFLNAHPKGWMKGIKSESDFRTKPGEFLSIPEEGSLGYLAPPDTIKSSFLELDELLDALQDLSGVLILSDVSAQTSGEAIMRRQTRLDNTAYQARLVAKNELDRMNELISRMAVVPIEPILFPALRVPSEEQVRIKIDNTNLLLEKRVITEEEHKAILRDYLNIG